MDFFIATLFSLFSIVDPPGAIPVYVALTAERPLEERNRIALHTSLYFLLILLSFFLAGSYILSFFGLTIHALRIAGGMALLISGFGLMSGNFARRRGTIKPSKNTPMTRPTFPFRPWPCRCCRGRGPFHT
ncbi:MAG: MarC family protein [Saprospirales bacterium]|nr:MarC family protein [Saprospirales bacterium]